MICPTERQAQLSIIMHQGNIRGFTLLILSICTNTNVSPYGKSAQTSCVAKVLLATQRQCFGGHGWHKVEGPLCPSWSCMLCFKATASLWIWSYLTQFCPHMHAFVTARIGACMSCSSCHARGYGLGLSLAYIKGHEQECALEWWHR